MVLDYTFTNETINVDLSGELDMFNAEELAVFLEHVDALDWDTGVLHMQNVNYIDVSGATRIVCFMEKQIREGKRKIRVAGIKPKVLASLSLFQFDRFMVFNQECR